MSDIATTSDAPFSPRGHFLAFLKAAAYQPALVASFLVLAFAAGFILVPQLFTHFDPLVEVGPHLTAPSIAHFFGTDELGRDLYARIVYGAVYSLTSAGLAIALGFLVGGTLGLVAGALGGWFDTIVMRTVDMLLAIPALLLSFSVITLLGAGTLPLAIAVGITSIAGFARLTRSQVARIAHLEFVEAAYGSGATFTRVLIRHILPNTLPIIIGYAALQFGHALLQIATLGFLGYGVEPPTPEWGVLISEGRNYVATAWWLTVMPGLVVIAIVLSANRIGRYIGQRGL